MQTKILIVGAGLSGLVAARKIQSAGHQVTVLDKGRRVGGRLATRRMEGGLADHGAQFFTARTEQFQQQVDQWLAKDRVFIWGHGWSDGSLKRTASDGHPRYATRGGMNQLASDLASDLKDVQVEVPVQSVTYTGAGWTLTAPDERAYTADVLLLTPPVPQSLQLLRDVPLSGADRQALERVEYGPCLCGLFVVEGAVDLPEPGALQDFEKTVYWIADNKAKGISDKRIITLHAGTRYSRQNYDAPDEETLAFLRGELEAIVAQGTTIGKAQLKKWRYSIPLTTYPRDYMSAEGLPLYLAGDAFGGRGRVEGAYMSGLAAADAIIAQLRDV